MVEPTGHCPYLGLKQNRAIRFASPTPEHRCYVTGDPQVIPVDQVSYCLSSGHTQCPLYTGLGIATTNQPSESMPLSATPMPKTGIIGWFKSLSLRDQFIYLFLLLLLCSIIGLFTAVGMQMLAGERNPSLQLTASSLPVVDTPSPTETPSPTASPTASPTQTASPTETPELTATPEPPTATPIIIIVYPTTPPWNPPPPPPPPPPAPTYTPLPTYTPQPPIVITVIPTSEPTQEQPTAEPPTAEPPTAEPPTAEPPTEAPPPPTEAPPPPPTEAPVEVPTTQVETQQTEPVIPAPSITVEAPF